MATVPASRWRNRPIGLRFEEEIGREGLMRDWGAFARFVHLAAAESGAMVNHAWTEHPDRTHARHLLRFLDAHAARAERGWIVRRCAWPMETADRVTATPWWAP